MRLHLLGVRGSTPAAGAEFVGVGGHTSCVAVVADGDSAPSLVLDAGTGLQRLTDLLGDAAFDGTIALTHLHWDHTHGLPFCRAVDRTDAHVDVLLPEPSAGTDPSDAAALMARAMSPPHFPVGPDGLLGDWTWTAIGAGTRSLAAPSNALSDALELHAVDVDHKGGRTFGYLVTERVGSRRSSMAYLPDHLPGDRVDPDLTEALRGADVLLHDAQFTADEADVARRFGHSTVDQAIDLAVAAGVGHLVLFHHGPGRTDDDVAAIESDAVRAVDRRGADLRVTAGREGVVIDTAAATVTS